MEYYSAVKYEITKLPDKLLELETITLSYVS